MAAPTQDLGPAATAPSPSLGFRKQTSPRLTRAGLRRGAESAAPSPILRSGRDGHVGRTWLSTANRHAASSRWLPAPGSTGTGPAYFTDPQWSLSNQRAVDFISEGHTVGGG